MTTMNRWDSQMFQDLVNVADDYQLQHMIHVAEQERKSRRKWVQRIGGLAVDAFGWLIAASFLIYIVFD